MKYLMTAFAACAALALAAPVSAQTTAPAVAAPKAAAGKPMAAMYPGQKMHHKHHWRRGRVDMTSEMLNQQELARLQGMGPGPMAGPAPMAMPPGPPNAGAGQGGPRASGH